MDIHPDDYEVIANVCDLRRFRVYCEEEFKYLVTHFGKSPQEALTAVVAMASKLNEYNDKE